MFFNDIQLKKSLPHLEPFRYLLIRIKFNSELLLITKTIIGLISNIVFIPIFLISLYLKIR